MLRRDATTCFLEFRRNGSGRAFRRFFERTAGELGRLAVGLCPPGMDPQDVLQLTYLRAIELRDRYDGERSVVPWLCGILANVVREERRRAFRRAVAPGDHAALVEGLPGTEHEPGSTAAAREAAGMATAAIARLPQLYRAVVDLSTQHGLTPAEIAHALDRPAATVRSQLHRGLELLRRGLPATLAPGLAFVGLGRSALAAVRGRVEAVGGIEAGASATLLGLLGGVLLNSGPTKLVALGSAAVVLILGLGWSEFTAGEETVEEAASAILGRDETGEPGVPVAPEPDRLQPSRLDESAARLEAETRPAVLGGAPRLLVRVVRAKDGAPFADVGLWLERPERRDRWAGVSRAEGLRTDATGEARFAGLEEGDWTLHVDRGVVARVQVPAQGEAELLVEIPSGVHLSGRVVDERERAVPGAVVSFVGGRSPGRALAWCDEAGSFSIEDLVPGAFVAGGAPGHASSGRVRIEAAEGSRATVTLRLGRAAGLSGVVRDPEGRARGDAVVLVAPADVGAVTRTREGLHVYSRRPLTLHADPQGAFTTDAAFAGEVVLAAAVPGAPELAPVVLREVLDPDRPTQLDIHLVRACELRGKVVDGAGRPLSGEEIHTRPAQPIDGLGHSPFTHGSATTDEAGRYHITTLRPGSTRVSLRDGRGEPAIDRLVELREGTTTRLDLCMDAAAPLEVLVVDPTGTGLTGWLVRVGARHHVNGTWARTTSEGLARFERVLRQPQEVAVYSPSQVGAEVRFPAASRTGVRASGQQIRFVVGDAQRPGALRVAVIDSTGTPVPDCPYALESDTVGFSRPGVADAQGVVHVEDLPPGSYRLRLMPRAHAALELDSLQVAAGETTRVDRVRLGDGGSLRVELLLAAGVDPAELSVEARTEDGLVRDLTWNATQGCWRSPPLAGGAWVLSVHGPRIAPRMQEVWIQAGTEADLSVEIRQALERSVALSWSRHEQWVRGELHFTPVGDASPIVTLRIAGELGPRPLSVPIGLPEGSYEVDIDLGRDGAWRRRCEVARSVIEIALE